MGQNVFGPRDRGIVGQASGVGIVSSVFPHTGCTQLRQFAVNVFATLAVVLIATVAKTKHGVLNTT